MGVTPWGFCRWALGPAALLAYTLRVLWMGPGQMADRSVGVRAPI